MISRTLRAVAFLALALPIASEAAEAAGAEPLRPSTPLEDRALVEGGLLIVRLDPKRGAPAGACDTLSPRDLAVTVGGVPATVTSVRHLSRPERHWLLLDTSESTSGRRGEAVRSAAQYVRAVMEPGIDSAAVITIDDDVVLAAGPSGESEALASRIEEIPSGGASALRDGLDTVLRQMTGSGREQLVLFWTDGEDTDSLGTLDELLRTIDRSPQVTVFPVVLFPSHGHGLAAPNNMFLFEVAKRSGGEVLASSDRRWLDRVRGWIARRFTAGIALPQGTPHGRLAIALRGRPCEATLLRDPFARPPAIAGASPPVPRSWVRLRTGHGSDETCSTTPDAASWDWPWRNRAGALVGCMLDESGSAGRVVAREVRVLAPPFEELPRSLEEAVDQLIPPRDGPSPALVSGRALLLDRTRIAASLFAQRPDLRDFALSRLARRAEEDLAAIERELARAFPELPPARVAETARASRDGRRALEAARAPTDADLAGVLAAWLSDVPARSLFQAWERRLVDERIASRVDPSAEARWTALRKRFTRHGASRVAAPLILFRDAERDLVGFHRVVLPRPRRSFEEPEDRIPQRPLGLLIVERVVERPEVIDRLRHRAYKATRVDEEGIEPAWGSGDPFRRARVTVALEPPDRSARLLIEAQVRSSDDGATSIARFATSVTGDPELAALLRSFHD